MVTDSLPNPMDQDVITKRVIENLNSKAVPNLDNVVPKLDSSLYSSLKKMEASIQTDEAMTYDYLRELIYNMGSVTQSLGEISPTDFVSQYRNDPALAHYFYKTAQWADSISRQSSSSSANSEILFMRKIGEDIKSIKELIENNLSSVNLNSISPIENISSLSSNLTPQFNIENIREDKLNEIINYVNEKYPTITSDPFVSEWIKGIVDQYDYLQLLSTVEQTEIINKINCNIIIWSCGIF